MHHWFYLAHDLNLRGLHALEYQIAGIMKYGSTPYIGMAPKINGCSIVCVQSDMFKTLP